MEKFAVSMFFRKNESAPHGSTVKERLCLDIIDAENEAQAFGIAYDLRIKSLEGFDLCYKICSKPINTNQ